MNAEFWKGVFDPQWIARAILSIAITCSTVWVIAFKTADYVVAANVSSMNGTLSGLQSSLDRLSDVVRDNTTAATRLQESIAALREGSASQSREISFLRDDVTKIARAVQEAGIQIKISQNEVADAKDLFLNPGEEGQSDGSVILDGDGMLFQLKPRVFQGFDCGLSDSGQTVCTER